MAVPIAITRFLICMECEHRSMRARSTFKIFPRSGRIAWVRRSLPVFAVPPAESPSTMNSSASSGDFLLGSQQVCPEASCLRARPCGARSLSRPLAALRALSASNTLFTIDRASSGFSSRYIAENASPKTVATALCCLNRTKLCFGLSFKLNLRKFYGNNGCDDPQAHHRP